MGYQDEIRQLFFSNLLALGMEPIALERKWKIPFNKDMFILPNKKGFEIVMHFLFDRLNHTMCQEQFKSCWPVIDKKHEQQFRKVCRDWLQTIASDDANANLPLPRIVASLFMSPGGDKMYQLFFYFSTYIVQNVIVSEIGLKNHDFLLRPVVTKQNKLMSQSMSATLKAGCARHRQQFIEHAQEAVIIQNEWKVYASELVKMYRMLTHDIRDLEQRIKEEVNVAAEKCASRGSPHASRRKSGMMGYDFDVQNVRRAQRIRRVRELWQGIEEFIKNLDRDREVIESILEGSQDCFNIDANKLNVRIPDLLLRECEQEIQRRSVDNVYQGGKLNLVSLLNLWNLSLHLYIEKLHQCGLPDLQEVTPKITAQAHTHQAHLTNATKFRSQLKNQMIPDLKKEIRSLKEGLDAQVFRAKSPESIRMTSIGLGFMPPTPPVNFSGEGVDLSGVPGHEPLKMRQEFVSTPEAAEALMSRIDQGVKAQQLSHLVQGTPVFAGRLATQGKPTGTNTIPSSRLPIRDKRDPSRGISTQPGLHGAVLGSSTMQGVAGEEMSPHLKESARKAIRAQASRSQQKHDRKKEFRAPVSMSRDEANRHIVPEEVSARVERHTARPRPKSPKAIDLLADEIADAVILGTPSRSFRHVPGGPIDLEDELLGHAFVSKDKLARTPEAKKENVATKLFTEEFGSDEDDGIVTVGSKPEPRPEPSFHRRQHPSGCEDESSQAPPAKPQQQLSPSSSPISDRIRDMRLSYTTFPGGGLPSERSFAMTSDTLVMTGDLLGMTSDDHLDAARPPNHKVKLSPDDSTSVSSTDKSRTADQVADLPESITYTSSESTGDFDVLETLKEKAHPSNPTSSLYRRDVIGAELPSDSPTAGNEMFGLIDLDADAELITNEPLPGFSGRFSLGGPAGLSPDQNENFSPSKSGQISDDDENGNDLEELANVSARIIQLQNESFTDRPGTPTLMMKTREVHEDLCPSPFKRSTDKRGSFRDVEQNILTSFINSSLHGLGHSLGVVAAGGSGNITGAKSPIRSRSPRTAQPTIKPTNISAAEIIARYKMLKENRAATSYQKSDNETPDDKNSENRKTSPLSRGLHTPERSESPLNELYLQKTPTKSDAPLVGKFTLDLDNEPDLSTPPTRANGSGVQFDYKKLGISPLVSPGSSVDDALSQEWLSPSSTPGITKAPGQERSINMMSAMPMSPFTEQLHNFESNFERMASERLSNIFDEEGPVLLPSSPFADEPSRKPYPQPAVGQLLDI